MRTFLAVILAVSACSKKDDKAEQAEKLVKAFDDMDKKHKDKKPTGTAHPQGKLKVTRDGKPVDMQTALAVKRPDGSVDITVSSVPLGCDEVTGNGRMIYDGEVYFSVILGQNLGADGKMQPILKQWSVDAMTTANPTPATGTGDGSPNAVTTVDLDLNGKGMAMGKEPAHEVTIKGTVEATGCAAPPAKDAGLPLPPEQKATIEIAGKKLAVRGAQLRKVGDWPELQLTTGGETCERKSGEQSGEFTVSFTWFKPEAPVSQVSLGGTLLPNKMDQTFDKKKLVVKPAPPAAGEVEIHGDIKVMDYPVKIDGKVTAVECPKK